MTVGTAIVYNSFQDGHLLFKNNVSSCIGLLVAGLSPTFSRILNTLCVCS